MPDSLLGVAFYVFALFPGIAFIFAREGHRPAAKRSAIRETASIVFVSVVCDAALALAVVLASLWSPLAQELHRFAVGDYTWVRNHPALAVALTVAAVALTTLLGRFLGSEWAHRRFLWRVWRSAIPRDTSAWVAAFDADIARGNEVRLGVQLKSGRWLTGALFAYDNDPEPGPHRTLTLTRVFARANGSPTLRPLADLLIVEASEIEFLQVAYVAPSDPADPSTAATA